MVNLQFSKPLPCPDPIRSKAHEIGSKYGCYNLYFIKCVFLTEENHAFVYSTDQKNRLHTSDFAYKAYISNKSGAIEVHRSSTPLPPVSTFLHTRTQTN